MSSEPFSLTIYFNLRDIKIDAYNIESQTGLRPTKCLRKGEKNQFGIAVKQSIFQIKSQDVINERDFKAVLSDFLEDLRKIKPGVDLSLFGIPIITFSISPYQYSPSFIINGEMIEFCQLNKIEICVDTNNFEK